MYKEHKNFVRPKNPDRMMWRYLDFTKFVSLLDSSSLFFVRADKLADPFEGATTKLNLEKRKKIIEAYPFMENAFSMGTLWRKYVVINSWFLEDFESVAMWKTYLKSDEGIAIQTTFKDFTDSLIVHTEDDIQVGVVKYTDYETEAIPEDNIFAHFLHKRKSFGHEKEIRALISRFPIVSNKIDFNKEMFDDGLYVKVDLNRLIKKIYVSPYSKIWFYELTKSITKKYGFSFEVKDSCLKQKPVF